MAAVVLPPTTDWLLETPPADWRTPNPHRIDKETPDGA
jgi:hypothetical protein